MGDAPASLSVGPAPDSWRAWLADLRNHGPVLGVLARKDFHTRYKRASFGVLWAVALPVLQGTVLAIVFSRVAPFDTTGSYGAFVLSGTFAWTYLTGTVQAATTSIVDGAALADKVWFPRAVLVLVPVLANLVGLGISFVLLVLLVPFIGDWPGWDLLLLVPASVLLVALATAISLVLSALHVYFRDTRFLVQAWLVVAIYLAPIIYPAHLLGRWEGWLDANPATGVIELVHAAATGAAVNGRALLVTVLATAVLLVAGAEAHRRHDRLFVDQL